LETALGGADTTTRLQAVWQVKVRPNVAETECDGAFTPWPPIPPLNQRGVFLGHTTGANQILGLDPLPVRLNRARLIPVSVKIHPALLLQNLGVLFSSFKGKPGKIAFHGSRLLIR